MQVPISMNSNEVYIYSNIILFIITRIYSYRFKQLGFLLTIVASKRGATEFLQRICLNHKLRIINLTLFLIDKGNVKRVSRKCQERVVSRGVMEVNMILSDNCNERTYCIPYSTEYSKQYRMHYVQ